MSLRWRIAIGLAIIAALVSALCATGAYLTTAHQLEQSIDDSLLGRSVVFNGRDRGEPDVPGASEFPIEFDRCPPPGAVQPAAAVQVIAASGTVIACYAGAPTLPVDARDLALARREGEPRLRTVTVGDARYRMLTFSVPGGALQTARDLDETESVLSSLRLQLIALSLIAIAAAAVLGWLFARRIVRPVERLREVAERIARTQDLDVPVPNAGPGEIGSLAGSFSTMVDALGTSRRQQQQLVNDASHELRTPLTSLRTNAELLERGERLTPSERTSVAQGIQLEVNELTNTVAELVELANDRASDDEDVERVKLGDLASEVADRARRRTARDVSVTRTGGDEVLVRRHMAERAIANLVDNAIKYGGDEPIEIVVTGRRLEVLDRGPGIGAADQPKVFDRFYRAVAARTEPGSGLGLAIVKQTVDRHDGTVWATNRDGGGAAVGFELPAPEE